MNNIILALMLILRHCSGTNIEYLLFYILRCERYYQQCNCWQQYKNYRLSLIHSVILFIHGKTTKPARVKKFQELKTSGEKQMGKKKKRKKKERDPSAQDCS